MREFLHSCVAITRGYKALMACETSWLTVACSIKSVRHLVGSMISSDWLEFKLVVEPGLQACMTKTNMQLLWAEEHRNGVQHRKWTRDPHFGHSFFETLHAYKVAVTVSVDN